MTTFNFQQLADNWKKPLVPRTEVGEFSGGILHPRSMANRDSLGEGPSKITVGKRVYYEPQALVDWMRQKYISQEAIKTEAIPNPSPEILARSQRSHAPKQDKKL